MLSHNAWPEAWRVHFVNGMLSTGLSKVSGGCHTDQQEQEGRSEALSEEQDDGVADELQQWDKRFLAESQNRNID